MDYLQLILPSVLAYAVAHLPWLLGAGVGIAVLWSPPMRRLRAARSATPSHAVSAEEAALLRGQLAAAQERIRVLERALASAPPVATPIRRSDPRATQLRAEGHIPTPV